VGGAPGGGDELATGGGFRKLRGLLAEFEQGAVSPAAVGRGIKRDDARHAQFSRFLDGGIFLSCGRTKC
jgi:hypothetical protein